MRTRALITVLSAAALVLTGCGSDAEPNDPVHPLSDSDAGSDPLLACGPMPTLTSAQFCVPGVGAVRSMTTNSGFLPTPQSGAELRSAGTHKAGDTWVGLALTTYTRPSSGLSPASIGAKLDIFDVKGDSLTSTVDLGSARVTGLIAVDGADTVVAALDSDDYLRASTSGSPTPDTEVTMVGIRPSDGTILWRQNDVLTSTVGVQVGGQTRGIFPAIARSTSIPAYRVPKPAGPCAGKSNRPTEAIVVDAATGKVTRSVALATLPGPRDNSNDCTDDDVQASVTSPIVEITREALGGFGTDANYNLRTNQLAVNGAPLPRFADADIDGVMADPIGDLAVITVTDHGRGLSSSATTYVIDQATGEVRNTIDTAAISSVRGKIKSIYGGRIYVQGPEELFTLDAATGKETGLATAIPVREVNGWTLHENGAFTKTS